MKDLTKNQEYSEELANIILDAFNKTDIELDTNKRKCLSWVLRAFHEKYNVGEVLFNTETYDCPVAIWNSDSGIEDCLIGSVSFNTETFVPEHIGVVVVNTGEKYDIDLDELHTPNYQDIIGVIVYQNEYGRFILK